MSEAELYVLRARLNGGIHNKAARGELRRGLPVGLIWGDADGDLPLRPSPLERSGRDEEAVHCGLTKKPIVDQGCLRTQSIPAPSRWAVRSGVAVPDLDPLASAAPGTKAYQAYKGRSGPPAMMTSVVCWRPAAWRRLAQASRGSPCSKSGPGRIAGK